MKNLFIVLLLCFEVVTALGANQVVNTIIPRPRTVEGRDGFFLLQPSTQILVRGTDRVSALASADYLAQQLRKSTGYELPIRFASNENQNDAIVLSLGDTAQGSRAEAYALNVSKETVQVNAGDSAGLFYGGESLLQLFPPEVMANKLVGSQTWKIPAVQIEDGPRFPWRGFLLDVGRHFFSKAEIKTVFDLMAMHKLNVFQWHLTDDQGWRLEIKKYPRLTEVGAWRKSIGFGLDPKAGSAYGPDGRYGGYYTQDDIRELVSYAQARHITIVPEIEMPGHASAALAAYPQLSCFGGAYNTDEGNLPGAYCAGKEETFEFLKSVLDEVCQLFPSKYIHIGGDEVSPENWKKCPKCQACEAKERLKNEHELESYFIRRIEKILNERGRTLVGWSEIREGGLAKNATIMDWIGGAVESAREGHDVIMTPTEYCYLDYYQSTNNATAEPRAIGGYVSLRKVYSFEPVPARLEPQFRSHIIGAQGNLWTEYIASLKHAQYMALPRLCALAEVTWSPSESRNFDDFMRRLQLQARRFDLLGVNYRHPSLQPAPKLN